MPPIDKHGHSGGQIRVKASAWPCSPWIRVLGRGGVGGLVDRALIQNVRGIGLNPTWSPLFPRKLHVSEKILYKINDFCTCWISIYDQDFQLEKAYHSMNQNVCHDLCYSSLDFIAIVNIKLAISEVASKRYFNLSKPFGINLCLLKIFPLVKSQWVL